MRFESLGENCEFGLVQRRCGADPLGLFRFGSTPIEKLLEALEARLEGLGAPGRISIELSANGREYMVNDHQFGLPYHAWVLAGEMTPDQVLQREMRRLPLLIRKLIEDLSNGAKIFVCHGMDKGLPDADVQRLTEVARGYGPNTVLWVGLADEAHPPGTVEWAGPDLLKGYIDRFAPGDDAHEFSLAGWVAICREAHRLWQQRKDQHRVAATAAAVTDSTPTTAVAAAESAPVRKRAKRRDRAWPNAAAADGSADRAAKVAGSRP